MPGFLALAEELYGGEQTALNKREPRDRHTPVSFFAFGKGFMGIVGWAEKSELLMPSATDQLYQKI